MSKQDGEWQLDSSHDQFDVYASLGQSYTGIFFTVLYSTEADEIHTELDYADFSKCKSNEDVYYISQLNTVWLRNVWDSLAQASFGFGQSDR